MLPRSHLEKCVSLPYRHVTASSPWFWWDAPGSHPCGERVTCLSRASLGAGVTDWSGVSPIQTTRLGREWQGSWISAGSQSAVYGTCHNVPVCLCPLWDASVRESRKAEIRGLKSDKAQLFNEDLNNSWRNRAGRGRARRSPGREPGPSLHKLQLRNGPGTRRRQCPESEWGDRSASAFSYNTSISSVPGDALLELCLVF